MMTLFGGGNRCFTVGLGNVSFNRGVLLQLTSLSVSAGASSTCEEEEASLRAGSKEQM